MFQKEKFKAKFKSLRGQLQQFTLTQNNTFLMVRMFQDGLGIHHKQLIHSDFEGNILKELRQFDHQQYALTSLTRLNDEQFVYVLRHFSDRQKLKIEIVNIKSGKCHEISHQSKCVKICTKDHSQDYLSDIDYFRNTKIIAFSEKAKNSLRITYYDSTKLWEEKLECLSQLCFEGSDLQSLRMDSNSKMAIWSSSNVDKIAQSLIFSNLKGEQQTLKNVDFGQFIAKSYPETVIYPKMLETQANCYFINFMEFDENVGIVQNKFVVLSVEKDQQKSSTLTLSTSTQIFFPTEGINQSSMVVDYIDTYWIFYGCFRLSKDYKSAPFYLFDKSTNKCVLNDHQQAGTKCLDEQFNFWHSEGVIVRAQLITQDQIVISKTTIISRFTVGEVSMQMLLHIHQDFDDDLLQDAIELLQ